MPDQPISDARPANPDREQWPDRLRSSASLLCRASLELQAALLDERRFGLLTDPNRAGEPAAAEIRAFNQLLAAALTSLIDLTAYDNPDQEYPELGQWFEFKCPNVVYGRRTDTLRR
jgi:hypothetical protein